MKESKERIDKMKKNKGFTLIELLAVIVILAIIALIAVPVVMNIINSANKSAFKDSAYGILKAGELFYTDSLLENAGNATETTFTFPNDIEGLEFKGSKPSEGKMIVNKDGKVAMAITNGKYCVTKGFEDDDVKITDDVENCEIIVPGTLRALATTGTFTSVEEETTSEVSKVHECAKSGICEPGTAFAIKVNNNETYKFYVLSDTGKEVTLIMDRNLGEPVDWITVTDYDEANADDNTECTIGICRDEGPLTALSTLKERTKAWSNLLKFTYILENDADGKNGPITYPNITGELVTDVVARLPRREEIYALNNSENLKNTSWIYENFDADEVGYWTSTTVSVDDSYSWNVYYDGYLSSIYEGCDQHSFGIRPVITLSK